MYETEFRNYDPALGRFTGVDALAASTMSWSPYQFAFNNPVIFNDPTGLQPKPEKLNSDGPNSGHAGGSGGGRNAYASSSIEDPYQGARDRWDAYLQNERTDNDLLERARNGDREALDLYAGKYGTTYDYKIIDNYTNGIVDEEHYIDTEYKIVEKQLTQGDPFGGGEKASNSLYTSRGDYVGVKDLFAEFLTGAGPERSIFYGSHRLTQGVMNSAIVRRAKDYYAANIGNGQDMVRRHIDFFETDVPFVNSDIEQFIGSARVSIYPRGNLTLFVVDNTTSRHSGSYDSSENIPRVPGQLTPMGNIYQRFAWVEEN